MKFIDLFAGVGGFRLGMERAGHECVWSCEVDRWCRAVYEHQFKERPAGDARQVRPESIPDFDCLCAGFPCQSFSVAGKRKGFRDPRGTLFYEICRIAEAKRPRLLLLENVKGLLSSDRGETFLTILQELGRIGYGVEWQVLNSKNHGVPQNRERVFVVGHLGGLRGREVFPVTEGDGEYDKVAGEAEARGQGMGRQVASALRGGNKWEQVVTTALDANYYKGRGGDRTLIAEEKPMIVPAPIRFLNRNQRNFDKNTAMTVDTACSTGVSDGVRIRRLTPRECERLQGFPDDWTRWGIRDGKTVEISDTQRYRMMGNAVTVNVVEFLARRLPA